MACSRRLFVLQHGSHGSAADFDCLKTAIAAATARHAPDVTPEFLVLDTVRGKKTDRGLKHCINALSTPIVNEVAAFEQRVVRDGASARGSVTFVGHSMGGLMLRGVVRDLHRSGYFGPLVPKRGQEQVHRLDFDRFVTVGTPHLGVGHTSTTLRLVAGAAMRAIGSVAYRDMLLRTSQLDLLASDKDALAGLARFQRRVVVAAQGDHLVAPASSLIAPASKQQVRRLAADGLYRTLSARPPASHDSALVPFAPAADLVRGNRLAKDGDLYSAYADANAWRHSSPRLEKDHVDRVSFMCHQLRSVGPWDAYVACCPLWAAAAAHRAVLGKAPYNTPGTRWPHHIEALARITVGEAL